MASWPLYLILNTIKSIFATKYSYKLSFYKLLNLVSICSQRGHLMAISDWLLTNINHYGFILKTEKT